MIEVTGITIIASVIWVITALCGYASITASYSEDRQMFWALTIVLASISFILTMVGIGVVEVI